HLGVQRLPRLGVAGGARRLRRGAAALRDQTAGHARQRREDEQILRHGTILHAQRGCVSTSTSAGSPRFTISTARLIAGPSSSGLSIGPCADTPYAFASAT